MRWRNFALTESGTGTDKEEVIALNKYKLVAPDIDRLLNCFERGFLNPSAPSEALCKAMDPLFEMLRKLAPLQKNDEAKAIWVRIPRGLIEDFGSYEDMVSWGDVKNREEYEQYWLEEYPDPVCWYELVIAEAFHKDGSRWFRAVHFGNKPIINAHFDHDYSNENAGFTNREEAAVALCSLLMEPVREAMRKLEEGTYNEFVETNLPYSFRKGVVLRSVLWEREPEWKESDLEGLPEETISAFRRLLNSGANDEDHIKRLNSMTANDFFRACAIGYEACGYKGTDLPPVDQYFLHGDGRDEGLSGRGHGLNAGPGIDFDDPAAWDEWYFHREQHGGHPWEVCRGGNSTHVDLRVMHDRRDLDFYYRTGEISEAEYQQKILSSGYYFLVGGTHRAAEAVRFYTALSTAGLPVILSDAEDIMTRFDGTGYVGIVPHSVPTRYCEDLFPEKYGDIIDFIHVYGDEMEKFGDAVEWLPEEEAKLI